MAQQAMELAQKGVPWRRGMPWWLVGVEGAILTAVGIYVIAAPDDARDVVVQLIGWFLIANAVLAILASLRGDGPTMPITPYRMLAAGIGLTVGLLVALEPLWDYVDSDAGRGILALGLLGHGLVGLYGAFATRASGGMRRGALVTGGLNVALAVLLFYNIRREALDPRWFGVVAIIGGVLLLGFAFALYRDLQKASTTEVAPSPPLRADPGPTPTVQPQVAPASNVEPQVAAPLKAEPQVAPPPKVEPQVAPPPKIEPQVEASAPSRSAGEPAEPVTPEGGIKPAVSET